MILGVVGPGIDDLPGTGGALTPHFSTSQRCTAKKNISAPGMTNTCRAKNRLSESPPMIGPPRAARPPRAQHRHPAGHRPGDGQAPVGVRIPTEDLARKEHAQRAEAETRP